MIAETDVITEIHITEADLDNPKHAEDIVKLVDLFARDPMGQDEPLDENVRVDLIDEMKKIPTSKTFLAYIDEKVVGIVNCFIGFSTFNAKRVFKIHDLAVHPDARGMGVGTLLLKSVESYAKEMNCVGISLEVREDNPARKLYERAGFKYGEPRWYYMTKEIEE